ncbi:MAG: RHS repeat domain-containing protein [Noviherbaspirillum sp.]
MDYDYQGGRLVRIRDDTGYAIELSYITGAIGTVSATVLDHMSDTTGATLVRYGWSAGQLTSVTDRYGHVTSYAYNADKLLASITLPDRQTVNGQLQTFEQRRIQFSYQAVGWNDTPHIKSALDNGPAFVLSKVSDATGAKTSFEYSFRFGSTVAADDRDSRYQYSAKSFLQGGVTRVIDALGNARATSNEAEFVAWRQAGGYYASYDAATVAASATLKAQYTAIRNAQSVSYQYDADGYLTGVTDEQGFQTVYAYDAKDNLTSVVDRNGYGAVNSDSSYYRTLRKDLGYVDAGGNGKLARDLGAAEKTALLNRYTARYTYDGNGNMLSATDNAGNQT